MSSNPPNPWFPSRYWQLSREIDTPSAAGGSSSSPTTTANDETPPVVTSFPSDHPLFSIRSPDPRLGHTGHTSLSLLSFRNSASRFAATLSVWGDLKPGDHIAVFVPPSIAYAQLAVVVHGCLLASMVPCLISLPSSKGDDGTSAMRKTLQALKPIRCLVATPEILFDLAPDLPKLNLGDILREENIEWERVLVYNPLLAAAGSATNRTVEGFVTIGDLEWMGKGIEERGVRADSYRRGNTMPGQQQQLPMTVEESAKTRAFVKVLVPASLDSNQVNITYYTHADLNTLTDQLISDLFHGIRAPKNKEWQHLALFSSLGPELTRGPSFPLLFLPPLIPKTSIINSAISWTWILVDDSTRHDENIEGKRPYVTVIKADKDTEDAHEFAERALGEGVGRKIVKGASL